MTAELVGLTVVPQQGLNQDTDQLQVYSHRADYVIEILVSFLCSGMPEENIEGLVQVSLLNKILSFGYLFILIDKILALKCFWSNSFSEIRTFVLLFCDQYYKVMKFLVLLGQ